MRHLASVRLVSAVEPIPGADAIGVARVLGWWVVVKRGEFAPGDPVVYCEVDSLLPERPEFEFLRKGCFKPAVADPGFTRPAGFRIKTVKLRGQVSQGICFPIGVLPPGTPAEVGADVTAALGVVKYEAPPPAGMAGRVKGGFPGFLPKTDETRVQLLGEVLAKYAGTRFGVTEKLDGASVTCFLRGGEYGVCSRNLHLDETDDAGLVVRLTRAIDAKAKLEMLAARLGHDVAVQGEVVGPGVQGNKYALAAHEYRVFNLLNADAGTLVERGVALDALDAVGLKRVPELAPVTLAHTVDQLVSLSAGESVLNPKTQREGLVLRPFAEVDEPLTGGRLSFKVINPQFLLKYDE